MRSREYHEQSNDFIPELFEWYFGDLRIYFYDKKDFSGILENFA